MSATIKVPEIDPGGQLVEVAFPAATPQLRHVLRCLVPRDCAPRKVNGGALGSVTGLVERLSIPPSGVKPQVFAISTSRTASSYKKRGAGVHTGPRV